MFSRFITAGMLHRIGGLTMSVDIFFECKPERARNNKMELWPDSDVLPLDYLHNSFVIYQDETKAIIKYRADDNTIKELQEQTGCADPLSQEAVDILGITGSYLGRSITDVFTKYPELGGTRTLSTDDGDIEVDIVRKINIL